jgi:DNA-binding response OmpR family regulator
MGRQMTAKLVQILYIGKPVPDYDKLWELFQREGIQIACAATQKAGLEKAAQLQPQVVVVNPSDAAFSAERLCRALPRRLPNVRRLVVLDRLQEDVACEHCLIRPFTMRKLRDTLLKLLEESAPRVVRAGALQLDVITKTVIGPNGQHHLTPKQCSLLATFMRRPNQVISRKELMDLIWDTEYLGDTRTLDVHICWLREKIELDAMHPMLLVTCRGIGYVLVMPELMTAIDYPDETLELDCP